MSERKQVVAIDGGYAAYDQEEVLLAAARADFHLRPCGGSEEAALDAVHDADVIMVRESPVTRRVLEGAPRCKAVIRYGIGVDNIDRAAARELRIMVCNVPDYGTDEVATQTVALALAVARRLRLHDMEVRAGRWSTGVLKPMHRLRGATLGLVGYGRIARMTQAMFAGFGIARVMAFDPEAKMPEAVEAADVDAICREADLISLHAPVDARNPQAHRCPPAGADEAERHPGEYGTRWAGGPRCPARGSCLGPHPRRRPRCVRSGAAGPERIRSSPWTMSW
jgi:D-3-phosphoglycerate dehydrogenase